MLAKCLSMFNNCLDVFQNVERNENSRNQSVDFNMQPCCILCTTLYESLLEEFQYKD